MASPVRKLLAKTQQDQENASLWWRLAGSREGGLEEAESGSQWLWPWQKGGYAVSPAPEPGVSLPKPTEPEANDLLVLPGSLSPGVEHGGVATGEHPSVPPE